jgi:hypothetical protein
MGCVVYACGALRSASSAAGYIGVQRSMADCRYISSHVTGEVWQQSDWRFGASRDVEYADGFDKLQKRRQRKGWVLATYRGSMVL